MKEVWPEFLIDWEAIEREAVTSADFYTDQMAREAWPNAEIVEAMASSPDYSPGVRILVGGGGVVL